MRTGVAESRLMTENDRPRRQVAGTYLATSCEIINACSDSMASTWLVKLKARYNEETLVGHDSSLSKLVAMFATFRSCEPGLVSLRVRLLDTRTMRGVR
jgi:hypothetical protein